jgi:hypothetical protein
VIILLPELREILQTIPIMKRKSDCYITPHENWMPTGTGQPCIGIKFDGGTRAGLTCGVEEFTASILLVGFARMTQDGETAVCGEAGVGVLLDAANERLSAAWMQLTGCQGLEIGEDGPTDLYVSENSLGLVKLVRTVVCTLQR